MLRWWRVCVRVQAGVKTVVVGAREPANFVVCEGTELLRQAGVVVVDFLQLADACLAANAHLVLDKKS